MNIKIDKMKEELNNIAEKYSNDFNSQKEDFRRDQAANSFDLTLTLSNNFQRDVSNCVKPFCNKEEAFAFGVIADSVYQKTRQKLSTALSEFYENQSDTPISRDEFLEECDEILTAHINSTVNKINREAKEIASGKTTVKDILSEYAAPVKTDNVPMTRAEALKEHRHILMREEAASNSATATPSSNERPSLEAYCKAAGAGDPPNPANKHPKEIVAEKTATQTKFEPERTN